MQIYLDVCCLHRPFDDQSQDRIRLESEGVKLVLDLFTKGQLDVVSSEVIEEEVRRNPDEQKRAAVWSVLAAFERRLTFDEAALSLARSYVEQGLAPMDAAHLALAEVARCDILLTTDDAFIRRARALQPAPRVKVDNPSRWVSEMLAP